MIFLHDGCRFEKVGYVQSLFFHKETISNRQLFANYPLYKISMEKIFIFISNLIL